MKTVCLNTIISKKFNSEEVRKEVKNIVVKETKDFLKKYPDAYYREGIESEKRNVTEEISLNTFFSNCYIRKEDVLVADVTRDVIQEKMEKIVYDALTEAIKVEMTNKSDFSFELNGKLYNLDLNEENKICLVDDSFNGKKELDPLNIDDIYILLDTPIDYFQDNSTVFFDELWFPDNFLRIAGIENWTISDVKKYQD